MKPVLKSTAAAAMIASLALPSAPGFADSAYRGDAAMGSQPSAGSGPSESMGHRTMDYGLSVIGPSGVDPALVNIIKRRLAITEDQRPAWEAYIDALQGNAEAIRFMHEAMDKMNDPKTSAQDVSALMDNIHQLQRQALEDVQAAHGAMLDVLADHQKPAARSLIVHGELLGRSMGRSRLLEPCESDTGRGAPPKM